MLTGGFVKVHDEEDVEIEVVAPIAAGMAVNVAVTDDIFRKFF